MAYAEPYARGEFSDLRIAIVHDWLIVYVGGERVLEQIINVLPHADLFSVVDFIPENARAFLKRKSVQTSFVQRLPFARSKYRNYLPIMPIAVEQFDLTNYDLIISSSHAVAKGVITGPDQLHISYVHSPARYAWDLQHEYLAQTKMNSGIRAWLVRWMLHRFRIWDVRTANGVDHFLANSDFIRRRIWKTYRRKADVIYPPVDVERFDLCDVKDDFFLTAARMVPYKKIDLIVEAFRYLPNKRLMVIGDGPEIGRIRKMATSNVNILGYQSDDDMRRYMQRAQAFLFAAQEDFGIAPVEAQACGTPVIAFGKGGAAESICGLDAERPTGVLFTEPTIAGLIGAIDVFEKNRELISAAACRENATRFAPERFRREFAGFLRRQLAARGKPQGFAQLDSPYGWVVDAAAD